MQLFSCTTYELDVDKDYVEFNFYATHKTKYDKALKILKRMYKKRKVILDKRMFLETYLGEHIYVTDVFVYKFGTDPEILFS